MKTRKQLQESIKDNRDSIMRLNDRIWELENPPLFKLGDEAYFMEDDTIFFILESTNDYSFARSESIWYYSAMKISAKGEIMKEGIKEDIPEYKLTKHEK
jgi:hypothetical protein